MTPQFDFDLFMINAYIRSVFSIVFILIIFILAFAISFHMILRSTSYFDNVFFTFMTTIIIMLGDYDYPDNFKSVPYPVLSNMLLICYISVIYLLFANFFSGSHTEKWERSKSQTQLYKIKMKIHNILKFEILLKNIIKLIGYSTETDLVEMKNCVFLNKYGSKICKVECDEKISELQKSNQKLEDLLHKKSNSGIKRDTDIAKSDTDDKISELQKSVYKLESLLQRQMDWLKNELKN